MQLYRFERPDYFVDMLRTGTVSLAHPSMWRDPYESTFLTSGRVVLHAMVQGPDGRWYSGLPRKPDSATSHMKVTGAMGYFLFEQCFTECPESSECGSRRNRKVGFGGQSTQIVICRQFAMRLRIAQSHFAQ